jgi:hypothetical protein
MQGFRQFLNEQNVPGYHLDGPGGPFVQRGNAYLSSDQTGSEQVPTFVGHAQHLPGIDIAIPNNIPFTKKTGKIQFIERNKNPITIRLSDGTSIYLTWDEFRRIKEEPEIGKTMTVIFQSKPDTKVPSKIEKIEVN